MSIWSSGVHPIVESILADPPQGIEVLANINVRKLESYGVDYGGDFRRRSVESIGDKTLYSFGLPRLLPLVTKSELVHTISGVVPLCPNPWIASIEAPSSFYGLNDDWHLSERRRLLLRKILSSGSCKRITCFSDATRRAFLNQLGSYSKCLDGDSISTKTETLYPAVNPDRFVQASNSGRDPFRILFIGNHFFDKGGRELFKAVSELTPRYDIQLDMIARAPPHHQASFREFVKAHDEKWVRWYVDGVPRKRIVEEFYPKADLFVMCSYIDLFGFVILEAMASRLPVIAANVYAQSELVEHGVNGFLVDSAVTAFDSRTGARTTRSVFEYRNKVMNESLYRSTVDEIKGFITILIEDEKLRTKMAEQSLRKTTNGVFSVSYRNKRLREMYVDAI